MKYLRLVSLCALISGSAVSCITSGPPATISQPVSVAHRWSYDGPTGPNQWADIDPAWAMAREGKQQSPIDITEARMTSTLYPLEFAYNSAPLELVNTGRTIEQRWPKGSSITLSGTTFELKRYHFHCPSEHLINGRQADLEMQLEHQSAEGKTVMLSILYDLGVPNPFLGRIADHFPKNVGSSSASPDVINPLEAIPLDRGYYFYQGSLTTPPCLEGVQWYVFRQTQQLSSEQLKAFGQHYFDNRRPVQPLNGRTIWATN